jgi:putative peptidoglycan lipid II flippase
MSARDAGWATLVVVPAQVFLFTALVVAGRVAGGVLACQVALTCFLLPHALLGNPLSTVLYPRMARAWAAGDRGALRRDAAAGLGALALATGPAAALLVALAPWVVSAVSVGALAHDSGPTVVAAALVGYGFGLTAYSWSLLVSRISYAAGDVRTPGLAALGGGAVGVAVLAFATRSDGTALLYRVGLAHTAMVTVIAVVTLAVLVRRDLVDVAWRQWASVGTAAVVTGVCARVVADRFGLPTSRLDALVTLAVSGAAAAAVYVAGVALAGTRLRELRAELA